MRTLMDSLAANKGASYGPDSAPVTIIEFSDFECPYCRKLYTIMEEVLPTVAGKVRVVFHHMPLQMHAWARTAAEAAACAQFQGSKPFWTIQRQIFERQGEITAENVKAKLVDIARNVPDLDFNSFQTCFDNEMSLGLVLRDIDLATANEINATPTLFINGHRLQGIKDAKQLRELIDTAAQDGDEKSETAPIPDTHAGLPASVSASKCR
jgi:protein-disulfide isomerase